MKQPGERESAEELSAESGGRIVGRVGRENRNAIRANCQAETTTLTGKAIPGVSRVSCQGVNPNCHRCVLGNRGVSRAIRPRAARPRRGAP